MAALFEPDVARRRADRGATARPMHRSFELHELAAEVKSRLASSSC